MDSKVPNTVEDILGAPESWRNYYSANRDPCVMEGAVITELLASEDGIAITTQGSECGETYTAFWVPDPEIRTRALRVLSVGMDVHTAVRLAI